MPTNINLINPTEHMLSVINKAMKANRQLVIDFSGRNYPWTSALYTAEKFASGGTIEQIIFRIKTDRGVPGKNLGDVKLQEHDFTILPGMKAKIKRASMDSDARYIVDLEEVGFKTRADAVFALV
jgi:hypothetical protein